MAKLRALIELRYDGVNHFPGAIFEATDAHAKLLKALKKCDDAPAEAPKPRPSMRRAAPPSPPPEPPPEPAVSSEASDPRLYTRRDMRSED